ncbi:MAG: exodeoxyribonuclease III [Nitrospirota bacterium]|nr:exodeoxyribonuclease III [Nitrospirota bacterium]
MHTPIAIATWNVNSLRSRLQHVHRFLREASPDVLCLQELKCADKDLPAESFRARGYHLASACQKTYNGVAIVSPWELTDVSTGFSGGEDDPQARLIAATVCGIRVINVYVPNGDQVDSDKYAYKLDWMARLRNELKHHHAPALPTLLCGDFNVAMDDRDVYDPPAWAGRVLCSDPERAAARAWLEWGLEDVFRIHHNEGGIYSWWDYRGGGFEAGRGLRIDHIWVTPPLAARCATCDVLPEPRGWEKPSDHAPVMALFEPGWKP